MIRSQELSAHPREQFSLNINVQTRKKRKQKRNGVMAYTLKASPRADRSIETYVWSTARAGGISTEALCGDVDAAGERVGNSKSSMSRRSTFASFAVRRKITRVFPDATDEALENTTRTPYHAENKEEEKSSSFIMNITDSSTIPAPLCIFQTIQYPAPNTDGIPFVITILSKISLIMEMRIVRHVTIVVCHIRIVIYPTTPCD